VQPVKYTHFKKHPPLSAVCRIALMSIYCRYNFIIINPINQQTFHSKTLLLLLLLLVVVVVVVVVVVHFVYILCYVFVLCIYCTCGVLVIL
jgi:hypothetical protein